MNPAMASATPRSAARLRVTVRREVRTAMLFTCLVAQQFALRVWLRGGRSMQVERDRAALPATSQRLLPMLHDAAVELTLI